MYSQVIGECIIDSITYTHSSICLLKQAVNENINSLRSTLASHQLSIPEYRLKEFADGEWSINDMVEFIIQSSKQEKPPKSKKKNKK